MELEHPELADLAAEIIATARQEVERCYAPLKARVAALEARLVVAEKERRIEIINTPPAADKKPVPWVIERGDDGRASRFVPDCSE